ncbi:STAS domain-containing protein [Planococcus sp. NCCP-2050]|uniref:STAS domain-containing protein n=1 Tax=Planococcus sp. NCCP-2050 TaxID=2944679 RepID=UPI00203DA970|nr:STAS domain-containing protein [Planococcus sp. NCCP-2050]GKW46678.1 RsbT co-antagonist protein RsbRC [Planococcus sp. NCCP-2050]
MLKHQGLYHYLTERTWELTEKWYEGLDKNKGGVYSSIDPEKIENLKHQNHEFHVRFCAMFKKDKDEFFAGFQDWIETIAKDEDHLSTPVVSVLGEFFRTQEQYLEMIGAYAKENEDKVTIGQLNEWNIAVVNAISSVILEFTSQNTKAAQERLYAQQQMIIEMSAPVILLTKHSGFLPLIGEITTHRAQIIFEKTLRQSAKHNIEKLFIDLSGVPIIDTMVAQQVFQLINGLKIIGVKTALSGLSPVIAQTAVHLGIKFVDIEVYNTLAQALKENGISLIDG